MRDSVNSNNMQRNIDRIGEVRHGKKEWKILEQDLTIEKENRQNIK